MKSKEIEIISQIEEEISWIKQATYCDCDNEYYTKLKEKLDLFLNVVNNISDITMSLENIEQGILDSVSYKYEGKTEKAYEKIRNIIAVLKDSRLGYCKISDAILNSEGKNGIDMYRARVSDTCQSFKSDEMRHIPFDMRQNSSAGRYSIPGLPCTYLANSSFCCWIEMGRPDNHRFNVSYVHVSDDIYILNLTSNYYTDQRVDEAELEIWCIIKMLQIATSFVIGEKRRSFKSEYIISQYIMQACREYGINGVAYYSTRLDRGFFSRAAINVLLIPDYKFDPDNCENDKVCKNDNLIRVMDSFNYAMYKELKNPSRLGDSIVLLGTTPLSYGNSEISVEYQHTEFYHFDRYMKRKYNEYVNYYS